MAHFLANPLARDEIPKVVARGEGEVFRMKNYQIFLKMDG